MPPNSFGLGACPCTHLTTSPLERGNPLPFRLSLSKGPCEPFDPSTGSGQARLRANG